MLTHPLAAHRDITGVAVVRAVISLDPVRVKIGRNHPGRRYDGIVDCLRSTEHDVVSVSIGQEAFEPIGRSGLVIVDEYNPVGRRLIEAGIASDRDIAAGGVDIVHLQAKFSGGGKNRISRNRNVVIVSDNDAERLPNRTRLRCYRRERLDYRDPAECTYADVDPLHVYPSLLDRLLISIAGATAGCYVRCHSWGLT